MRLFVTPSLCKDLPNPSQETAYIVYGEEQVLITSAHGISHTRSGTTKPADRGTFEFGHLVARCIGCSFVGQWEENQHDSNHHKATPLKDSIAQIVKERGIKLTIDIHSSHPARPYDVEIGTRSGRSLLHFNLFAAVLEKAFASHHLTCATDQFFKAEGVDSGETITEYVSTVLGVPAIQIELSAPIVSGDGGVVGYHIRSKAANAITSAWFENGVTA